MSDLVRLFEVTLSRVITEDGSMAVGVKLPDNYNAVEVLGLLEVGKRMVFQDMDKNAG